MNRKWLLILLCAGFSSAFGQSYYSNYQQYGDLYAGQKPGLMNIEPDDAGVKEGWNILLDSVKTNQYSKTVRIPFFFSFAGVQSNFIKVATTGFVTFDTTVAGTPSSAAEKLPTTKLPDKTVAVWGLNGLGSNDQILTKTFGFAPTRQFWVKFSSYSTPGDSTGGWNYVSVVFEELTSKMYVVSMYHNNATGKPAVPSIFAGLQQTQSTGINFPLVKNSLPASRLSGDNVFNEIIWGNQLSRDLRGVFVKGPDVIKTGSTEEFQFAVTNFGKDTVDSLALCYRINGGTVNKFVSKSKLAPSGMATTILIPYLKGNATAGTFNLYEFWSQQPNGLNDQDPSNDTLRLKVLSVNGNNARRKLLIETSTATWCDECPATDWQIGDFKNRFGDSIVFVKHHAEDEMASNGDSLVRYSFGNLNLAAINRNVSYTSGLITNKPADLNDSVLYRKLHSPDYAPITLKIKDVKLDTLSRKFSYRVTGVFTDYCPSSIRVGGITAEDAVRGVGTGWDQQLSSALGSNIHSPFYQMTNPLKSYYHDNVSWHLDGSIKGKKVTHSGIYAPGDTFSVSFQYTFPKLLQTTNVTTSPYYPIGTIYSYGKPRDIKAVGFVALENGNNENFLVLNAEEQQLWDLTAGVKDNFKNALNVYPNPGHGIFNAVLPGGNYHYVLYGISGQKMADGNGISENGILQINVQNVSAGLYYLQITGSNNSNYSSTLVIN